jgi:hypothetical protein
MPIDQPPSIVQPAQDNDDLESYLARKHWEGEDRIRKAAQDYDDQLVAQYYREKEQKAVHAAIKHQVETWWQWLTKPFRKSKG